MDASPPEAKLRNFFYSRPRVTYNKGDIVWHSESISKNIAYLAEGYIKMLSLTLDGKTVIHSILGPSSLLPNTLLVKNQMIQHDYQALCSTVAYKCPLDDYYDFVSDNPDVQALIVSKNLEILSKYSARLNNLSLSRSYHRLVERLLQLSDSFGSQLPDGAIKIDVPLTHQDIADSINTIRETTSRHIKKLEHSTIVGYDDRYLIIFDPERLRQEADTA